jgi:hypothetical protein
MSEDLLVNKGVEKELQEKEKNVSDILMRNINVLKKQAESEGISSLELAKIIKSE